MQLASSPSSRRQSRPENACGLRQCRPAGASARASEHGNCDPRTTSAKCTAERSSGSRKAVRWLVPPGPIVAGRPTTCQGNRAMLSVGCVIERLRRGSSADGVGRAGAEPGDRSSHEPLEYLPSARGSGQSSISAISFAGLRSARRRLLALGDVQLPEARVVPPMRLSGAAARCARAPGAEASGHHARGGHNPRRRGQSVRPNRGHKRRRPMASDLYCRQPGRVRPSRASKKGPAHS